VVDRRHVTVKSSRLSAPIPAERGTEDESGRTAFCRSSTCGGELIRFQIKDGGRRATRREKERACAVAYFDLREGGVNF